MIARIVVRTIVLALLALLLVWALGSPSVHSAGRKPRPCVGTVVRYIDPGMELVERPDGTRCVRASGLYPQAPRKVRR